MLGGYEDIAFYLEKHGAKLSFIKKVKLYACIQLLMDVKQILYLFSHKFQKLIIIKYMHYMISNTRKSFTLFNILFLLLEVQQETL